MRLHSNTKELLLELGDWNAFLAEYSKIGSSSTTSIPYRVQAPLTLHIHTPHPILSLNFTSIPLAWVFKNSQINNYIPHALLQSFIPSHKPYHPMKFFLSPTGLSRRTKRRAHLNCLLESCCFPFPSPLPLVPPQYTGPINPTSSHSG